MMEMCPIFLRPLDGNSSDKEHLSAAVKEVMSNCVSNCQQPKSKQIVVFDSGGYSEANMKSYNEAKIRWISRVPETSTAAKTALEEEYEQWHPLSDGSGEYVARTMDLPQGKERWIIVRPHARLRAAKKQMEKKVKKTQESGRKSSGISRCAPFRAKRTPRGMETGDERQALLAGCHFTLRSEARYEQPGKPKKDASPEKIVWHVVPTVSIDQV